MAVRMAHRWPWRPGLVGLALVLIGAAIVWLGWTTTGLKTAGVGLLVVVTATAVWWARYVAKPHTTKALIRRRAELDQRSGGSATLLDVAEHASPKALRMQAKILRPSTARLSRRQRRKLDPRTLGVLVAKLGFGLWGQQVWSSCEDATMRVGGPRTGKTQSLACHALDAPGALITTSTRLDLAEAVHAARLRRGTVHIFNPAGLGNVPSTLRWRVLAGGEDYRTATRRAADLIPPSTGEGERWDNQARRILALLLNAAALAGGTMRDVVRWSSDNTAEGLREIVEALLDGGPGGRDRAQAIKEFWATNDRTRSSITSTMAVPLAWMADDRARELGDADRGDPGLIDITELIERRQTLHLIGHEDHASLSPLIAALVAEIAHAARQLAAAQPGGRLDPPLTLVLDEAAIAAPVPLDRWTADMGGRGVTIHISVQSLAQLRSRWGDASADAILANVATFLVFGGSSAAGDLRDLSLLTGEHRMPVHDAQVAARRRAAVRAELHHEGRSWRRGTDPDTVLDPEQRGEFRWIPVLSPAQIRALQPGQVLVLRRGLPTLVGYAPRIADRRGRHSGPLPRTREEAAAQLEAIVAEAPVPLAQAVASTLRRAAAGVSTLTGRVVAWWTTRRPVEPEAAHVRAVAGSPAAQADAEDGGDRA
jgi:type IV secretion system protein VirD4